MPVVRVLEGDLGEPRQRLGQLHGQYTRRGRPHVSHPGRLGELALHLTARELHTRHRWTLLGWAWPLARQLAQLAVLVFVFSSVLDLGIENYPVFVFAGLVCFTWFSAGIADAAGCLVAKRHLVLQPRFPAAVLPIVAVAVPLVDVLLAVPVLGAMLAVSGDLTWHFALLPLLAAIQLVLMAGMAWIVAPATAFLRDVPNVVGVGLLLLFYVTPVFYDLSRVPDHLHWVLRLNPLTTLVEAYRDVLIHGRVPAPGELALLAAGSALLAIAGFALFRRLEPRMVDEL
jgi:lipopolysaccharide transport system permease protein